MEKQLVYVRPSGGNTDGTYEYELFFSNTPDDTWGMDWDIPNPASLVDPTPDSETYQEVYSIKTTWKMKTLEETTCYPMEYAIERVIALSWIDLDGLEDYPELGRCVLHFGDTFSEVEAAFSVYDITLKKEEF